MRAIRFIMSARQSAKSSRRSKAEAEAKIGEVEAEAGAELESSLDLLCLFGVHLLGIRAAAADEVKGGIVGGEGGNSR